MARRQVQDDSREVLIAKICGLRRVEDGRSNVNTPDAFDENDNPFELKSATRNNVTTARDVSLTTVQSWRSKYWILAKGRNLSTGFEINALYIAHPNQLESFFSRIEARLNKDWSVCMQVLNAAIEGNVKYEIVDKVEGILQRGITINNPKIPMRLFEAATQLTHNDSVLAKQQRRQFVELHPLNR